MFKLQTIEIAYDRLSVTRSDYSYLHVHNTDRYQKFTIPDFYNQLWNITNTSLNIYNKKLKEKRRINVVIPCIDAVVWLWPLLY